MTSQYARPVAGTTARPPGAAIMVETRGLGRDFLMGSTVVHALEGGRLRKASRDAATPLGDAARP